MSKSIFARDISVNSEAQTLTIDWADGHKSVYSLEGLRLSCPCVECAGGHEFMNRPADPTVFQKKPTRMWEITDLREIGNYAMQIVWGDGHDAGIYRWEFLRDLSPAAKD